MAGSRYWWGADIGGAFIGRRSHCGGEQSLMGCRYLWEHSSVGAVIVAGSSHWWGADICGSIHW